MTNKLLISIAAVGALLGTASIANAACQQVFSHTTCSGWGPMQKCQNHFKQVCSQSPTTKMQRPAGGPQIAGQQNAPKIAPSTSGAYGYGGIVAAGGGNMQNPGRLIGNDGSTMRR